MFEPWTETEGLYSTPDYLIFRWLGEGEILFSVTQKGEAAYCHFCSDRAGLRHVRRAFIAFSRFIFWLFDWCKMIITTVSHKPSIERALSRCGFFMAASAGGESVWARAK